MQQEIRHLNRLSHFCHTFDWCCSIFPQIGDTDSNVKYLIHTLCNVLSLGKFGLAKEKFLSQCNMNILQNKLLHCQPSPSRSNGGYFFAKVKCLALSIPVRHIEYTTFKHFPLTELTLTSGQ